jgi:hypothetical protein
MTEETKLEARVGSNALLGRRRVVCAANQHEEYTLLGPRHWGPEMRKTAKLLPFDAHAVEWSQGFIDQRGVWMDRREAWKVAEAAGQILYRCGGDTTAGGTLFSENLY